MNSSATFDDTPLTFYVGQHETERRYAVTDEILHHAQDCNFDFLTSPITNDAFHSRVLSVLSSHPAFSGNTSSAKDGANKDGQAIQHPAPLLAPLTPLDTALAPSETISQLILIVSPWIDLASSDPVISSISQQVLMLEVGYAAFCGANNILIQGPRTRLGNVPGDTLSQYARAIREALHAAPFVQIHLSMPMVEDSSLEPQDGLYDLSRFARDAESFEMSSKNPRHGPEAFGSWDAWNLVRSTCNYTSRLSIALTIPHRLPDLSVQLRWFSEPLRILNFHSSAFHRNAHSRPSLTKTQQQLITRYMRLTFAPWILLSDVGPLPDLDFEAGPAAAGHQHHVASPLSTRRDEGPTSSNDPTPAEAAKPQPKPAQKKIPCAHYLEYLRVLQRRQPPRPPIERFGAGYHDYLQSPLQPLTDNLESMTYETFEKDPIKYDWYERAIEAALADWARLGKPASGPEGRVVLVVVGAGRGPLVTRSLRASEKTGVPIDAWAVEKNPNAFVLLQRTNIEKWNDRVTLVHSDMRGWPGPAYYFSDSSNSLVPSTTSSHTMPEYATQNGAIRRSKIDILISELLGSFADNELSPECLDGIQHHLNPTHGISIPTSYTAHLTPIATPNIHSNIVSRLTHGDEQAASLPYVVMLQAVDYLSYNEPVRSGKEPEDMQPPKVDPTIGQAWAFSHPIPPTSMRENNAHNKRFSRLEFKCRYRGVCHGIAGYFETVLYESSYQQPDPQTTTPGSTTAMEVDATGPADNSAAQTSRDGIIAHDEDNRETQQQESRHMIELSTNPLTMAAKSEDMISWFPIFFPLKTPLSFPDNSILAVSMWRQTDGRRVWYEWMIESFIELPNASGVGQRVRLGMTELHTSEKNACLM